MRQLNKEKTPIVFRVGVALLCVLFITSYMMGGLYARYTTTVTGSATARVAKIDCAVNYEFSGYGNLGGISGDDGTIFVIMEEFSVENTGEVTYTYDLSLVFSKDISSANYESPVKEDYFTLEAPQNVTNVKYVYHSSNDSTTGAFEDTTPNALTGFGSFEKGKVYYSYSSDGTNYSWATAILSNGYLTVPKQTLIPGQKYYYKIIYFIEVTGSTNITQQQMTLFYNITCEQVD